MRLLAVLLILTQTGCAYPVYSTASLATGMATGKSLTDRAVSQAVPYGDCNVFHVFDGKYYCEIRDPAATYNRSAF